MKVKYFFISFILLLISGFVSYKLTFNAPSIVVQNNSVENNTTQSKPEVLGKASTYPQIYISGGDQGYSAGGMIALASTDEPSIVIGGYGISGDVQIAMYEAKKENLIDYLLHDKDGKQTKKNPDIGKFRYITTVKQTINTSSYQGSKVTLPLSNIGIWYLEVQIGKNKADAFIVRSEIGILAKEGDNEFIFWGQNFKTKRSITEGSLKVLNLLDNQKELQSVSFDSQGIAKAALSADADIAIYENNLDLAIIPLNLHDLNYGYNYTQYSPKQRLTRYFIFTDRPLYKPGDTVYFKAILRDDDDVRYTIPASENLEVKIYDGYYYDGSDLKPEFEKNLAVSNDGTISGEYKISENAKVGYRTLSVKIPSQPPPSRYWNSEYASSSTSFDVQYFRKPEFSIDVTTSQSEIIASDKASFKISGSYFSGQPLAKQKIKYTVYASDFYEYLYLIDKQNYAQNISNDYRYGYWYGAKKVTEGTATLDSRGEAEINLNTIMTFNQGKSQIFSIEVKTDSAQNPTFSRRNILVYAGEYGIYRKDILYRTKVNTPLSLPLTLVPYNKSFKIAGTELTAKIKRISWIEYQEKDQKYPSYRKEEENLPDLKAKTNSQGDAIFNFIPTKTGSYGITVEGIDARGNKISKVFYVYVSQENQPYYSEGANNELTLLMDKQRYQPDDTIHFNIFSNIPDRDVFLSLERGRVNRYQVIRLNGKNASFDVPIVNTDIPNIYASVSSFSSNSLDSNQANIIISSDSKKLLVNITPDSKNYGPGETVNVNISTTDLAGNPVSSELALWAVDKAIFQLSDNKLGDIFETFWKQRYNTTQHSHSLEGIVVNRSEMGGCFLQGTKVLVDSNKTKKIEDIKAGDYVLTRSEKNKELIKAKVLNTHASDSAGYLIINSNLKVTENHILRVNNKWLTAGSVQIGDKLINNLGDEVKVVSIEWQKGKNTVYNLEIDKYHTYFAESYWVHNQKGEARNAFKDTAYWNPSIRTDSSGHAKISFKLPDNLTTWTLASVASTEDTKVGQTTTEIVATKDVVIRPILPNILRTEDKVTLSALVQNFTEQEQTFAIDLKFDSGDVEKPNLVLPIKSHDTAQVYWTIYPKIDKAKSKLTFTAQSMDNKKAVDIIVEEIPMDLFGFSEQRAESGEGDKNYQIKLGSDVNKNKSKITLVLSSTMIGTLPVAMKYLINYPYGCVEQTTSRFVPAVIARANQSLFKDALEDKNIDDIIKKGILRLASLQQNDGGWTWWHPGTSEAYVTAYVVEYLIEAKKLGIEIDREMLKKVTAYLEKKNQNDSRETQIAKAYALTLLGSAKREKHISTFDYISPDFLSLAVMTNYLNGDNNPSTNGLYKLQSMAQTQGDTVFWQPGDKLHFGSYDASTALSIRAMILAEGDRDTAAKAVKYLTRAKKSEYWSNTFGTAQTIRALVDFSKTREELNPNYNYNISLDGKIISSGEVLDSKQTFKDITIPTQNIKKNGSVLKISKSGSGQLYSTIVINEFHTDKNAKALNNGLYIKRKYQNEKGPSYSIGVGDTVLVQLMVGGLKTYENYGVINDELPSGLVPINTSFNNEQYGDNTNNYYDYWDASQEVTKNGIVLSLSNMPIGEKVYTYKARAVSAGTFIIPPAVTTLMYYPEIYGRGDVQTIKINDISQEIKSPINIPNIFSESKNTFSDVLTFISILVVLFLTVFLLAYIKGKRKDQTNV